MITIEESVDIRAPPEAVFALVSDVARKARLNPAAAVLGVTHHPPGPVGVGTVFHYRLIVEGRLVDYRSRCVAFEPGRLMETISDTQPPFTVRVTVEPAALGARLTQRESFALARLVVPVPRAPGLPGRLLALLFGARRVLAQSDEHLAAEERCAAEKLRPQLAAWLASIKAELERVHAIGL